jgi:predicted negative regulator of RcsB-dependent stress response
MKTPNVQHLSEPYGSTSRRPTPNIQWGKGASVMLALALSIASARAAVSTDLSEAARPLEEGVPQVAVTRLRALLNNNLRDEDWRNAAMKLAEALIAAKQPTDALSLLDDIRLREVPSTAFWRAQALASLRRWSDALPFYQIVAADDGSPFHAAAIFGTAEMWRALARSDEALQILARLLHDKQWNIRARLRSAELFLDKSDTANARRMLDEMSPTSSTERKELRFLRGRLELVQHRPERAIGTFESLVKKPHGVSHALVLAALFGIADAHLQLKTPEAGDDFLEDFIDHHPQDVDLPLLFAKLDELYRAERKPARVELERWTRESEQPRRAFALWYLARIEGRAGHRDRALQLLSSLRKSDGKTSALAEGLLELAKIELEDRHFEEALGTLEEARLLQPEPLLLDRINLTAAEVHFAAKQFEAATTAFEQIAHSASPFAEMSMFNASLGWLQLGDPARFAGDYGEFEKQGGNEEARAELRLEEGLVQAAKGNKDAADSLQRFLREFPRNPRASEAWVALAELAFHAVPPRLDEARKNLARAVEAKPTAAAIERGEYLTIWIEDSVAGNDSRLIELANQFLKQHAASPFAPDVRMKLAEAYYRRQDFPNAQTQFEIFAQQNPSARLAEKALFFAAESAMSSMGVHSLDGAIVLFDQVVQLRGDLRWAARNEQAVIERRLGKMQAALLLYDEVLKNEAKPSEKREALCGKGDIFFDLGTDDPKNYQRAIDAYDQLAADANGPGHWHNQALFKKGICLEKKAERDAALSTFYKVLETQTRPDRPPEFFWFYKAGFNAARLLENDSRWGPAAAVYEKLVAAGGTRSDEAKARLSRLRLEHFLWED